MAVGLAAQEGPGLPLSKAEDRPQAERARPLDA